MTEDTVTLAFFSASHYIVHAETGAILNFPLGLSAKDFREEDLAEGFEKVTKDQLFERWSEPWWLTYERLDRKLASEGSA